VRLDAGAGGAGPKVFVFSATGVAALEDSGGEAEVLPVEEWLTAAATFRPASPGGRLQPLAIATATLQLRLRLSQIVTTIAIAASQLSQCSWVQQPYGTNLYLYPHSNEALTGWLRHILFVCTFRHRRVFRGWRCAVAAAAHRRCADALRPQLLCRPAKPLFAGEHRTKKLIFSRRYGGAMVAGWY
jgi:hypothetical protein